MAQGYYQKLYKSLKKAKESSASANQSNTDKLQNQIDNKMTRLQSSGVDTEKATDSRNGLEKFLGLPEDQNFVFDIFELLNRPQQALFGAVNAAQKGEDAGAAAWSNFKGDTDTQFKDILTQAGMSDTKGKLDLVDVLGFAGDVILDPMDIALIPVTGGANIAVQAADTAGDVAKAAKVADTVGDVAKGIDTASDVAKATKGGVQFKSATDLLFEGAGKALKGGAKVADKGIEKGLKFLDETKGVENAAGDLTKLVYDNPLAKSAANLGKKTLDGAGTNVVGRLETYKDVKDTINRAFNYAASVPEKVRNAVKKNNADSVRAAAELKPLYANLDNGINSYATNVAKSMGDESAENIAKIAKQTDKDLSNLKEYMNLNREVSGADLLKEAKNGKLTAKAAGEEGVKLLNDMADDINKAGRGLKLTVDTTEDGLIKLSKDWDYIMNPSKKNLAKIAKDYGDDFAKSIEGVSLDGNKLMQKITKNGNYTQADLDEFGKLMQKYADDDTFKQLYDTSENVFNEANKIIDKHFGTKMSETYGDNAGYVRHAFDKDQFDNYQKLGFVSPYGNMNTKGSAKVLADRTFDMSAREANNMFKDSIAKNYDTLTDIEKTKVDKMLKEDGIFKEGMSASFDDYLRNVPQLAQDSNLIDNILVKSTFGDYDELKSIDKQLKSATKEGNDNLIKELSNKKTELLNNSNMKLLTNADSTVPRGFKQLNSDEVNTLVNKMNKIGDELGLEDMKKTAQYVKQNGGKMAINNDILRLIDVNTDKKGAKGLTRLYDKYLNFFKKNKVMSPTFQMNNLIGNTSNMYLAGISPTTQAKLFPEAINVLNNGENLMIKAAQGVELTSKEKKMLDVWNNFIDAGFGDAKSITAMNMADMPDSLKKYFTGEKEFKNVKDFVVDGLPYLNNKMNNYLDTASRLVTFMEGSNNPKFLQKLGVESASDAVRKVLFDPTELTTFERNFMKRAMPFYTFTKKNLAFQLDNLTKNGTQYHKLLKGYDNLLNAATDDNSENVSEWLKNNLYIPIPGVGEDGSYKVVRASMPFGNVIDTATDPLNTLVSLTSPITKMPFELATGVNSFTGNDIEKFKGQKSTNIPGLTKMQEYLLGSTTGLDVPAKVASRAYNGIADTMNSGGNFGEGILGGLENMTTMDNNINTDKMNKMYEQLDELETIMNQYKQNGYEFSTINELKKANQNRISEKIMATLNKLNGLKSNPYSIK